MKIRAILYLAMLWPLLTLGHELEGIWIAQPPAGPDAVKPRLVFSLSGRKLSGTFNFGADEAPLRLYAKVVAPEWIDYNGHAHESRYLQVFGDTTDALLRHIGLDLAAGGSYFTVETHISHLGQARAEERLHTTTQLLGHDAKRLHVFHSLYRTDDGALLATAEQMLLHVDTRAERASPADPALLRRIERISAQ